jgi:hypothetical protein
LRKLFLCRDLHSLNNRLTQVEALFTAGQTPPAFHPTGSLLQLDPRADLPSVDPWASPPIIGEFDAHMGLVTQGPELPPFPGEYVPGTLLGSWSGSFLMNSPDAQDTEPPTLRPLSDEFDWGAELSNLPPVLPSITGLEGCSSMRKQYFTVQSYCSNDLAFLTKYSEFNLQEYQRHQSPSS